MPKRGTTLLVIPVLAFSTSNYRTSKKKKKNLTRKPRTTPPPPVPQVLFAFLSSFVFLEGVEETSVEVFCRYCFSSPVWLGVAFALSALSVPAWGRPLAGAFRSL